MTLLLMLEETAWHWPASGLCPL